MAEQFFGDYLVERVARKLCLMRGGIDPDYVPKDELLPNWRNPRHIQDAKEIIEVIFGQKPITNTL